MAGLFNPQQTHRAMAIILTFNPDAEAVKEEIMQYINGVGSPNNAAIIEDYFGWTPGTLPVNC